MLVMSKSMFCLIYFDVIITTVGTLYSGEYLGSLCIVSTIV